LVDKRQCGTRGVLHEFSLSYLSSTKQYRCTPTKHSKSATTTLSHGVFQGCTLRRVLLLKHINDLPSASNFKSYIFANDTTHFLSHKCVNDLETLVNVELNKIETWLISEKNNHTLFCKKSNCFYFK